jgi:hypothetical protein
LLRSSLRHRAVSGVPATLIACLAIHRLDKRQTAPQGEDLSCDANRQTVVEGHARLRTPQDVG